MKEDRINNKNFIQHETSIYPCYICKKNILCQNDEPAKEAECGPIDYIMH